MREIKFRAWDGCKMQSLFVIDSEDGMVISNGIRKNWPIMQYTGLKDKNGVEIYEGDIVDVKTKFGGNVSLSRHQISWHEEYAMFVLSDVASLLNHMYCASTNFEVIGNIYQNPELLENKDA